MIFAILSLYQIMKIRIRDNSIRLRLMQAEVKQFDENQIVEAHIQFGPPPDNKLTYRLEKRADITTIQATFTNNCISVIIPEQMGQDWAKSNQVSLSAQQDLDGENRLSILVEKDFQCLTDRVDEDESDAFPNPNTTC